MFIAMLFTIAKIWKHPEHPSVDEWIKKLRYIYLLGYKKKEEILSFVTAWMDLESIMFSEISQRKTNTM